MSEGFVIDTPEGIRAFALLQVRAKLKMEVDRPDGPKWRGSPAAAARAILAEVGRPDPGRTKKKVLAAFEAYLREEGLLS